MNFQSPVQVPESSHFLILWRGYHFRSGIIYCTIGRSFLVLGSFLAQFGDHLRARIIWGPVQLRLMKVTSFQYPVPLTWDGRDVERDIIRALDKQQL